MAHFQGTQAPHIVEKYKYCHIATGDLLREQITLGTDLGKQAKSLMDAGKLVHIFMICPMPIYLLHNKWLFQVGDDVVNNMVKSKISSPDCAHGFMLDGYPRTTAQVLFFVVPLSCPPL